MHAHAQMQIFAPALCRIFFHNLLCGILKTPHQKSSQTAFPQTTLWNFQNVSINYKYTHAQAGITATRPLQKHISGERILQLQM